MALFRKKPVVVEARPWTGHNLGELREWVEAGRDPAANAILLHDGVALYVRTLEGHMLANVGDWIIRGVAGEFYPCKPDIFAATYEEVYQFDSLVGERTWVDHPTAEEQAAGKATQERALRDRAEAENRRGPWRGKGFEDEADRL